MHLALAAEGEWELGSLPDLDAHDSVGDGKRGIDCEQEAGLAVDAISAQRTVFNGDLH